MDGAQEHKHELALPAKYFSETIRRQLCSLLEEDALKDTRISLRSKIVCVSSCILSLVSPVMRIMVCGNFRESIRKEICLDDVEAEKLMKLLSLACGKQGLVAEDAEELLELGELSERLQMEAVRAEIEDKLLKELKVENCLEMIQRSEAIAMERLQKIGYDLLWDSFEVLSRKEGFVKLSKETMGDLLLADELWVDREEEVFEALLRWMTDNVEHVREEGLLRMIRYGVMSSEYLTSLMTSTSLPWHGTLKHLAGEALAKKEGKTGEGMWDGVERLCGEWKVVRMKGRVFGAETLKRPAYVAVDTEGCIVVSDPESHKIISFNRDGSVARLIDGYGWSPELEWPTGVALDRQGRIVVSDRGNHRIEVLNEKGWVDCCFGSQGHKLGQFDEPRGVAIDREGHIVVADNGNNRIQVLRSDGSVVRHFGSRGAAIGQLSRPAGVAVDRAGRIVVADRANHRVQVFNVDGSVALCFGSEGKGPGQFKHPIGVAMDNKGRFVVADSGNHRVQVFNSDGTLAHVMGSAGDSVGQLRCPCGVAVDGAGRIFVVEGRQSNGAFNNHRVQALRMDNLG